MANVNLTHSEKMEIINEWQKEQLTYKIEDEIQSDIENNWLSFCSFSSCPYGKYESEEQAKEDFIRICIDEAVWKAENYDENPVEIDVSDIVWDMANDYGYVL